MDPATIWRWDQALAADGVAGLVPARRGPKGASKLTPELAERIAGLDAAGATLRQIAAATGVSTFSVRNALGRVPSRGQPATAGVTTGEGAARDGGDGDAGTDAAVPVLPGPVPRDGERALARWGLLGEGAAPAFIPGARYPLAGLLLALPALEGAGLLSSARQVYGRLKDGCCGLTATLLTLVFLALAGEPRAEGATRIPPTALGRVLGLDRAPEGACQIFCVSWGSCRPSVTLLWVVSGVRVRRGRGRRMRQRMHSWLLSSRKFRCRAALFRGSARCRRYAAR